ncbi:hypothetical protein [Bryobacter aggregatus]|uniref:hypothetical protein n=1 Tax=Bryobacter aggregatus TaxID=360054 RepID=UPI0004E13DB8|nr:hypothetical protein [Bryobacter aggregatus]
MRNVLAAMFSVAVAFTVILLFAFRARPLAKTVSDPVFGAIAGIAIVVFAVLLFCKIVGVSIGALFRRLLPAATGSPLPAAPLQAAAQLAYDEDPSALVTCIHLQPIERAMRAAGLEIRVREYLSRAPILRVNCRIHEEALRKKFQLTPAIRYAEGYEPERSQWDNPRGDIICTDCIADPRGQADILVLHPDEERPDSPWFPSPPATPRS